MKVCKYCKTNKVKKKHRTFCSYSCSAKWQSENNPLHESRKVGADRANWKGGFRYKDGYKELYVGRDVVGGNGYRGEHILIAEQALGRRLKGQECVHHFDGMKDNNYPTNLLICGNSYHRELEGRMADLYKKEHFS